MPASRTLRPRLIGVAALVLAGLGVAGCSDDGSTVPRPVAAIDAVPGGTTTIKLDPEFAGALKKLGLRAGTTGKGRLTDGSLVFPVTGGNVTIFKPGEVSPYVIGQLQHVGSGLSLSAGGVTVRLSNLNVDPGVSRVYGDVAVNGKTAAQSAFLFQLDGRTLEPLKTKGKTATLTGTKVEVSPVAAKLLDDTFDTKAVKGGLLVGTATITVGTVGPGA